MMILIIWWELLNIPSFEALVNILQGFVPPPQIALGKKTSYARNNRIIIHVSFRLSVNAWLDCRSRSWPRVFANILTRHNHNKNVQTLEPTE